MYTYYSRESDASLGFVRVYHSIGILVIILSAIPLHFTYEWSGETFLVGLFTPINESIWEHLKLVFWPTLLWWIIGFAVFRRNRNLSWRRWFQAMSVSIIFGIIFIIFWFYSWSGAFGVEAEWVNLSSLVSVLFGQLLAMHVYRVTKERWIYLAPALVIIFILAFLSGYFTYFTPDLPIFVVP